MGPIKMWHTYLRHLVSLKNIHFSKYNNTKVINRNKASRKCPKHPNFNKFLTFNKCSGLPNTMMFQTFKECSRLLNIMMSLISRECLILLVIRMFLICSNSLKLLKKWNKWASFQQLKSLQNSSRKLLTWRAIFPLISHRIL
jgi:hypothetical protein